MTPQQFFFDFFPDSYICAMMEGGGQFEGRIISDTNNLLETLSIYQNLNKARYNIYFTPNAALTPEGRNSLSNVAKINAWWIDIDIEACKKADDDETKILRENKKAEISGEVLMSDLIPSLTIETRNGFQLYWFNDGSATRDNWLDIAQSIYQRFKIVGADRSTIKIMQLMRVPNFYYIKNGEIGKITIWPTLSTFIRYSEEKMMEVFPPHHEIEVTTNILKPTQKVFAPTYKKHGGDTNDIFIKVINTPIDRVIQKLSGHWLVDGDTLSLQKLDTDKSNVLVNGKVSPNFIVRSRNHIYSNNANVKGPTIIQYLKWYSQNTDAKIAQGLREIFI